MILLIEEGEVTGHAEEKKHLVTTIPFGRYLEPSENDKFYFSSDDRQYITLTTQVIDG